MSQRRLPAEWEEQSSVLITFPHEDTDWNDNLERAKLQFVQIIAELALHGEKVIVIAQNYIEASNYIKDYFINELGNSFALQRVSIYSIPINDTWIRDYGPISVIDNNEDIKCLDFKFNAWGAKFQYDKDNAVNTHLKAHGVIADKSYVDCQDFILEGGSIESDGKGTIMTTSECLLNPNRNIHLSKQEIESIIFERLGAERILWLDFGHIEGDDTDSHIDTLCRFAPGDTILYTSCGENGDTQHEELKKMYDQLKTFRTIDGLPYNLIELPLPDPIIIDGKRLGATYANYLVTPHYIYLPTYNQPSKDRLAAITLQSVYPDRQVVPIDCRTLITQGGSLHCSTMQIL